MSAIIGWCAARARMILAFVAISIAAGFYSYTTLPKEGAPDIDVPVLYVSVLLPGVSAADAERLILRPLETELRGLEGLKELTGIAALGHASVLLEFEFGWDKAATLADVRALVDEAEAEFPAEAEEPTITEVNLSQLPILVVALAGDVPERTLLRLAKDLQRAIEANPAVLEAELTGHREEMIEVIVDPLRLESYDLTAQELLEAVARNNQLVPADSVKSGTASFSVSVPGAFERPEDVYALPIKVSGDRVVRLADLAEIRRTFEDPSGTARYNGEKTIALQVSKRIGENIIATADAVRAIVAAETARWPEPLRDAVTVTLSMDQSREVRDMVSQLEGAVITAVLLVMIVVLATLGPRSALLVGLAIPGSFLLSFGLMAALGMSVNNMTMFGLILAVGMLVDGAIVVVEHADKRIQAGEGPMRAYAAAARRMAWPIVSSTATTLCAFLPMLLWPGMPGEFMGQLPITLIFVLSASLIVALIYLPVLGGIAGRVARLFGVIRTDPAARIGDDHRTARQGRTAFGRAVALVVTNPVGPVAALALAGAAIVGVVGYYAEHQAGVEFFVEVEPERSLVYVRARGNLSLAETDRLVREVETRIMAVDGVASVFAFAGAGGLTTGAAGDGPSDAVGQVQVELAEWDTRRPGAEILADIRAAIADIPGAIAELRRLDEGPKQGKPIQIQLSGSDFGQLLAAAGTLRDRLETMPGLTQIDDTRPLPGIEWQITVDRTAAGRYGADIASIGPFVQLVTRGALLDTMRLDDVDEEIDIRARFAPEHRNLSTLDTLKVSTVRGLVPMANFITRQPVPELGEINRRDGQRFLMVRADVGEGVSEVEMLGRLEAWMAEANPLPAGVRAAFVGDREEQQESQAFLAVAFIGALGLMFVILLAQFNSVYNSVLVLSAVVMSVAGVLVGMLVMGQKFSIIMTGTGIVALAGIVVNNNIVLIDTFQAYAQRMNRLEAIVATAEDRIRPVLLTTITTMAGLAPMMFAVSLDFAGAEVVWGAPTALWWVSLATAVVFGLGTATVLTLVVTPAALALREWVTLGAYRGGRLALETLRIGLGLGRARRFWADRRLARGLRGRPVPEILWAGAEPPMRRRPPTPEELRGGPAIRAAE
ncbi:efflux RND transporter permease subunit [Paralimibaculum aggregatum]|uniref:Efflux RND transporter permease subunit n=1 Tax=Paralimibaculum aggregatum TaxID=3036245 RepID=A0ABQ6LJ55_9RHOB|nr:efflux RND transporter permease subunit [Limibaculum sp. NKW23]GMG82265.1 efflux RND transporter permease subunit [Limibaculum sp. NKW23]